MVAATKPQTGGCQCGRIRYEIDTAAILTLYCCHCRECQRQSSSGFGLSMRLPRDAFRLTQGALATWSRPTDRGGVTICHFCADCGTRIYHASPDPEASISLKAGSLDDTGWLKPVGHLWVSRAQPWLQICNDLLVYQGQPDTYDDLIARYRRQMSAGDEPTA